jgi:hypothetical protein
MQDGSCKLQRVRNIIVSITFAYLEIAWFVITLLIVESLTLVSAGLFSSIFSYGTRLLLHWTKSHGNLSFRMYVSPYFHLSLFNLCSQTWNQKPSELHNFGFFFFFGYEFGSWRFYSYTCGYEDTEYLDSVV